MGARHDVIADPERLRRLDLAVLDDQTPDAQAGQYVTAGVRKAGAAVQQACRSAS